MIREEKFSTTCTDGVVLKGLLLIPDNPKAVIQFNTGTAALKEFYKPFLEYLAEHDYLCCLWDYRGSGESAPDSLKGCEYKFSDYGTLDMPAIRNYLKSNYPDLPLLLVGHSAGGQQAAFIPNLEDYKGMLAIAVSVGYEPNMPLSYRLQSMFFFDIFCPLSTLIWGYVKAKPFGIMENLPKNVAREWHQWCSSPNYCFDDKFLGKTIPKGNHEAMSFPIEVIWTPDDTISNEKNMKAYWSHVKSVHDITFTKLEASELEVKEIGHFGFFKRRLKEKIWPVMLGKLDDLLTYNNKEMA